MIDLRQQAEEAAADLRDTAQMMALSDHHGVAQTCRDVATLLLTLAGALPEWRPISEAPRDGTHITARGVRGETSPPTTVHWFGPPDLPGLRAGGWYISVQQNEGGKVYPTEWMPLPLPPVPLTEKEKG